MYLFLAKKPGGYDTHRRMTRSTIGVPYLFLAKVFQTDGAPQPFTAGELPNIVGTSFAFFAIFR